MQFSVCIATWNRPEALRRTLDAALQMRFPVTEFEVVVVVDGTTDATTAMLDAYPPQENLRILVQANRGLPAARNAGIAAACGEYVLLLDDDIVCSPDLLTRHADAHARHGGRSLVFGRLPLHPEVPSGLSGERWARWYAQFEARVESHVRTGAPTPLWLAAGAPAVNRSIRRETVLSLGGFDESLRDCHEDWDFGIRAWRAGIPMTFEPTALAWHYDTKPATDVVRRDGSALGRGEVALARKHPEYRQIGVLSTMGDGSLRHRLFAQGAAALDHSVDTLLAPLTDVLEATGVVHPLARRAAHRLLAYRRNIEMYRSAATAVGSARHLQAEFAKRLPVLCYHHVGAPRPGTYADLTLSPERFATHVRSLARRGYTAISIAQWVAWVRHGAALPPKPVLFTFDDAFADLTTTALPVLREHGFTATVFVVTDYIGRSNEWDLTRGGAQHSVMTHAEIRDWSARGIDFGAHTRTHPDLTSLSITHARAEIEGSRVELEAILGRPVRSFAYPFGRYTPELAAVVSEAFDAAVTTRSDVNTLATPLHELRRIVIGRRDTARDVLWAVRGLPMPSRTLRRTGARLVGRAAPRQRSTQRVFLDCGSHLGQSLAFFSAQGVIDHTWIIHAFEPNPACDVQRRVGALGLDVTVHHVAVWTSDGLVTLSQENHRRSGSGSPTDGYSAVDGWGTAVTESGATVAAGEGPIRVRAIDFSKFVRGLPPEAHIVCKMNIEGSEFAVLRRMLTDGTIERIATLYVEFHDTVVAGEDRSTVRALIRDLRAAGVRVDTTAIHRIPYAVPTAASLTGA